MPCSFLEGPYLLLVTRRRQLGALCGEALGVLGVGVHRSVASRCTTTPMRLLLCAASCCLPSPAPPAHGSSLSSPPLTCFRLAGHKVYGIEATALLPVLSPAAHKQQFGSAVAATAEVRYRKLLAGVQLSKDFFFSYTWPLHQTVQQTFAQAPDAWWAGDPGAPWSSPRVWNAHLAAPLRAALGDASRWVVPLSHGFFEQRPLALLGRTLHLTLIARRSRQVRGCVCCTRGGRHGGFQVGFVKNATGLGGDHNRCATRRSTACSWAQRGSNPPVCLDRLRPQFAGTRYLKRGVTESGHCANDVEVEQAS